MTEFTKPSLKILRSTMIAEMQAVAAKYGMDAHFGGIRFQDFEFGVKMTVRPKNIDIGALADKIEELTTTDNANRSNGPLKIGSMIAHPARKHCLIVTGITARGSVNVEASGGGKYRLKMADALKYLVA